MEKKRTTGILLCGLYSILLGLFGLLIIVFFCYREYKKGSLVLPVNYLVLVKTYYISLSEIIVLLISAVYLLSLKNWARIVVVIFFVGFVITFAQPTFIIIRSIIEVPANHQHFNILWVTGLFNILLISLWVASIIYLFRPQVKELFKPASSSPYPTVSK